MYGQVPPAAGEYQVPAMAQPHYVLQHPEMVQVQPMGGYDEIPIPIYPTQFGQQAFVNGFEQRPEAEIGELKMFDGFILL